MSTLFISIFEVDPGRQAELLEVLRQGAEQVVRHRRGFESLTLLASAGGTTVLNYARWRSAEDAKAALADPALQEYARRAAALGKVTPGVFTVAAEIVAAGEPAR